MTGGTTRICAYTRILRKSILGTPRQGVISCTVMNEAQTNLRERQRLVGYSQLRDFGITYSRVHLDRLMAARAFPAKVRLSSHRIGWLEHELDEWLTAKAAARTST